MARREMLSLFDGHERQIHKQRELGRILSRNRSVWRLAESTSVRDFVDYLLKGGKLRRVELAFPHRKEVRYTWGAVSFEAVLLTVKPGAHFSHSTAVQLHELTEQDPRTVYINHEQRPKPSSALGLEQGRIDQAFRRKPRTTRNVAIVKDTKRKGTRVCLLNGKHTGYLGVEEREVTPPGGSMPVRLRLTDVERTLIDIAVRPFYAGGVAEVLKAYRRAAEKASVNRVAGLLRKLGYVYPYHQAIGFYLETAGTYDPETIALFRDRFEYEYDFYLSYGMKDTEYNSRWRIHIPSGLT